MSKSYLLFTRILGITQSIQNAVVFAAGYLVNPMTAKYPTYIWMEILGVGCLGLSILATALMWLLDQKQSNYLLMSDKQRKVFLIHSLPDYLKVIDMEK